jgi:hypothetical protein
MYHTKLIKVLADSFRWGPWVFSLCNRDASSPEFGSFDRYFWHYRTEREFPSATYQYLVLALACLYLDKRSPWKGNAEVKNWAAAGCRFWAGMQRRDGTFDEWLPYEQSHVATAFSMAMVTEALLLFRGAGEPLEIGPQCWGALEKAGGWLATHHDTVVLNHTAGAVTALGNLHTLTGDSRWKKGCNAALDVLESYQTSEGWFPEYGGADPGYTSVSIDFLAKYWRRSADERALNMLIKALGFFTHFVHPDGTVGGAYGSRNTRYLLPHGLYIMRGQKYAEASLFRWCTGQASGKGLTLHALDDRYRGFFLVNHLQTLLDMDSQDTGLAIEMPECHPPPNVFFPQAGIFKARHGECTLVGNIKKGCVFELFSGQEFLHADGGYSLCFADGTRATSQWYCSAAKSNWDPCGGAATFSGRLAMVKDPSFFHKALLPHRLLSHALGLLGRGGEAVNNIIKTVFVKPRVAAPASLDRRLTLNADGVEICDKLTWEKPCTYVHCTVGWGQMHVPSSNFHVIQHEGGVRLDVSGRAGVTVHTSITQKGLSRSIS